MLITLQISSGSFGRKREIKGSSYLQGAVAWNLFDIDAKFADVETVETCLAYLVIFTK